MSDEVQKANQEAVDNYVKGDLPLGDLTDDQTIMAYEQAESKSKGTTEQEIPAQSVAQEEEKDPITPIALPAEANEKIKDALADANREKQLRLTAEGRIKRLKEDEDYRNQEFGIKTEHVPDPDVDRLDDKYLGPVDTTAQRLDRLEAKYKKQEDDAINTQAADAQTQENKDLFTEIGDLQDKFPALKTTDDFKEFDGKFITWRTKIGAENLDKYLSDEKYRGEMDALGYKPDFTLDDLSKGLKIYEGVFKFREEKKNNFATSFTRAFKGTNHFEELIRNKGNQHNVDNQAALDAKLGQIQGEATTLGNAPASFDQPAHDGLIAELTAIQNVKGELSPEQARRLDEIGALIRANQK